MSADLVPVPVTGADDLMATQFDGREWASLRHMCDSLGIDYVTQLRKLKGRSWATVGQKPMVAADGKVREMALVVAGTSGSGLEWQGAFLHGRGSQGSAGIAGRGTARPGTASLGTAGGDGHGDTRRVALRLGRQRRSRHCRAWRGTARLGRHGEVLAWSVRSWRGSAVMERRGASGLGPSRQAWCGTARNGRAWFGWVGQAWKGSAEHGPVGLGSHGSAGEAGFGPGQSRHCQAGLVRAWHTPLKDFGPVLRTPDRKQKTQPTTQQHKG